jgi:hypothetical protein
MSVFIFFKNLFVKYLFKDISSKKVFDHYFFDLKYYLHQDASIENFAFLLNMTSNKVVRITSTYYHCSFQVLLNEHRCNQVLLELNNPVNAGLSMDSMIKLSGFESSEQYSGYLIGNIKQIKRGIKVLSIILLMMFGVNKVQSQVSIGVPVPSRSAMLDVSSTTKGFLPPRMSEIQRVLIFKPDAGLIVYQIDGKKGLYYHDGSSWTYLINEGTTFNPNETVIAIGGGVSDNITYGTVKVPTPIFLTTEFLNVGGFAGRLRTPWLIYGNNFDGTAALTSNLLSAGITSSTTLAVGGSTTLSGTLTLPSLSTSSLLVTNGSKTVVSGSLTGDITTSGLTATLTNTGVISGTYGTSTMMPIVTVDAKGRITTITVTNTEILDANATRKGLINTSTQTFAGDKTISGTLAVSGNATVTGTLLVGTSSPTSTAAVLELSSITQGFLPPRMTTTQRNAITNKVEGLTIWNTTNKQLEVYDGSYWINMNGNLVSSLNVGDSYGGGIVAYIFVPGDIGYVAGQTHGLIAAISDQTTEVGIRWFPGIFYDVTQTFLGQGFANTISIIASSGTASLTNYAAGLANSFRGGGYSDWYLPSKDELAKLYQNRVAIGNFATSGIAAYWSSSQKGNFNFKDFVEYAKGISSAWVQLFFESGGELSGTIKDLGISNARRVRACRVF